MFKGHTTKTQVEPMKLEDVEPSPLEEGTGNLADNHESRPNGRSLALPKKPENLATFLEGTTLHGARFLIAGHVFRRLLWLGAIIISFCYCGIQLRESLAVYIGSPFVTQITMNDEYDFPFPAVTLCNFNAINQRSWNRTDAITDLEIEVLEQIRSPNMDPSWTIQEPENLEGLKRNTSFIDMNRRLSHQIEDMLLPDDLNACTLNNVRCNASNFTSFVNTQYGQCYTINSGKDAPPIRTVKAGPRNGLTLRLNVERDSYTASSHNSPMVGLKVLVHHQSIFPDAVVEDLGFAVEPGKHSFCSTKRKEIINLPFPYATNCSKRRLNFYGSKSNYSKEACLQECKYRDVMDQCKCRISNILENEYPTCSIKEAVICLAQFATSGEIMVHQDSCLKNCPEACRYFQYDTQVTNAGLSEDGIANDLLVSLKKQESSSLTDVYRKLLNSTTPAEKRDYVRRNIVYLTIYFEELRYQKIEQVPSFLEMQLFTALGGNLGLFLGVSTLTILEFVDFIVRRVLYFVLVKLRKLSRS